MLLIRVAVLKELAAAKRSQLMIAAKQSACDFPDVGLTKIRWRNKLQIVATRYRKSQTALAARG
jgi:hypothetical protein